MPAECVADAAGYYKQDGCRGGGQCHRERIPHATARPLVQKEVPRGNRHDEHDDGDSSLHVQSLQEILHPPPTLRSMGYVRFMEAVVHNHSGPEPSVLVITSLRDYCHRSVSTGSMRMARIVGT